MTNEFPFEEFAMPNPIENYTFTSRSIKDSLNVYRTIARDMVFSIHYNVEGIGISIWGFCKMVMPFTKKKTAEK